MHELVIQISDEDFKSLEVAVRGIPPYWNLEKPESPVQLFASILKKSLETERRKNQCAS